MAFLVLLWITQHYTAERIIKTKYKKTKVVNYRQQNDNFNILETCTFLDCDQYRTNYDGHINITRQKCALGIQYKHESKEDIAGFISKLVARPEYGTIYQHKGMLLQNLHRRYLYIIIKLPHLSDLEHQTFQIVTITALYMPTIQTHYWMIHQQTTMNYTRFSVIILRLIIFKKWMLLSNYKID